MEQYIKEFILLFLTLNFITLLYRSVFNIKGSLLNCGLFAFCGSEPPDMERLKILGLFNQDRGKHSCGLFYDGEIIKGIKAKDYDDSLWGDFIQSTILEPIEGANVFIGHTRHATYGSHTYENAHPFKINDKLVLAHNGTISNIWALCTKHDVDDKKIFVDSLALGHIIEKDGFGVLEEYKGAAALLIHKLDEPNSLYVYHGASKTKENGEEIEERPLYMLKVDNGIYFSSLRYALDAIRYNYEQEAELVPYNKVIKITNGHITKNQIKIDRGNLNIEIKYQAPVKQLPSPSSNNGMGTAVLPPVQPVKVEPLIWGETMPKKVFNTNESLIYFHQGRYWMSIPDNKGDVVEFKICHGIINMTKKGVWTKEVSEKQLCFYQGVLLKTMKEYAKILANEDGIKDKLETLNFAYYISKYSRYPVTNLENEGRTVDSQWRFRWYKDLKMETSGFTPLFSNRNYIFKDGLLTKIICSDVKEGQLLNPLKKEEENKPAIVVEGFRKDFKEDVKKTIDKIAEMANEVEEEMRFFNMVWHDPSTALRHLSQVGKEALLEYIHDAYSILEEKNLDTLETKEKMFDYITAACEAGTTIAEELPKTGKLEEYIDKALENYPFGSNLAEYSDEYEKVNGVFVPKSTIQNDDVCPLPDPKENEKCVACAGMGLSSEGGKCHPCNGTGRKKKAVQPELFSETEEPKSSYEEVDDGEAYDDKKLMDDASAYDIIESSIDDVSELESTAEDLSACTYSEVATEVAEAIRIAHETLVYGLRQALTKYGKTELLSSLNKKTVSI